MLLSQAYYASIALRPGCKGFATDVCVPMSAFPEVILRSQQAIKQAGLLAPLVGHVGDGNFHYMLIVDPANASEVSKAQRIVSDIVGFAHAAGGTCTGGGCSCACYWRLLLSCTQRNAMHTAACEC